MGNGNNLDLLSSKLKLNKFSSEDIINLTKEEMLKVITELMNKNSNQENFLLNISHDLRGHLNVILSVMQIINYGNESVTDKKISEYMGIVKRNSLKMLKLINNLIDTTKLENNYYVLNKKNIDIISMVESTVNCIDKYAKQKNIQLIFDTNKEECITAIDPEVLDRIIMNLLSNAIKFSYSNTNVYIDIFVVNNKIKLSIRDEGPGISEEYQAKIFSRFYQLSKKSDNDIIGSGIGLDLVNYLVKTMDGDIKLESKNGQGCEFILNFPISIVEEKDDYCLNDNKSNKIQMLEVEFSDIYNN
ncbi:HAMP domain-containing histidine kinase [Clostridium sp. Sa3CUN1]|uniref:histidine kinase n=1 Tax=Clostridium gallinarum TaxID=2762246 RepID=A0ABR8Q7X0_9CLOT|nr:HAMP domain-containing sensor histidine kinase [Clostridium gallinarum]MBD7916359.1 HAMP domain-containing histidine kinase [Clostridium gallinarum]